MGIIAGIKEDSNQEVLVEKLKAMIKIQSHRDKQTPIIHSSTNFAIGMANKHDAIFCSNIEMQGNGFDIKNNDIHAFVDGIVLEVPKLKKELESFGQKIPVPLCSTIVEAAYERWGLDFMEHLEGEFACAIWDERKNRLVLARDPYGHKPIQYHKDHNQFVFSSEIKGILEANVKREIDLVSLSDYLSLNCIPYPATIFKGIYQVPPGSLLIYEKGDITIKSHWSPKMSENHSLAFEDAVEILSEKLKAAIRKRMVTDKTYSFLSGGIDSSAIVSFASEMSNGPVHAISLGFEEEEKNEIEDAKRMAKHVGAKHHIVIAKPDSFFEMLDTLVFHHDQPFTDTSAYPTYYAGQLASNYTDIILTGDGPDQSLAGSSHHVFAVQNNLFAERNQLLRLLYRAGANLAGLMCKDPTPTLFSKIQRKFYRNSLSPVRAAYDLRSYFPDIVKKYMCTDELWQIHKENDPFRHPDAWFQKFENIDPINKYLYADMNFYVPDDLMIKVDRMCMAHGLETLSPFQDKGLSNFINQLPVNYKINKHSEIDISTKYILKRTCGKRFPGKTLNKSKQGFGIPLEGWLKKENGNKIKKILNSNGTLNQIQLKSSSIINMLEKYLSSEFDYYYPNNSMIISIINLKLWYMKYINNYLFG